MKSSKLGKRITIVLNLMIVVMAVTLGVVCYLTFKQVYLNFYNERAKDTVRVASSLIDWEQLKNYAETGEEDDYSRSVQYYLNLVKAKCESIGYLYIFIPDEDHFTYIMEAQTDRDNPENISKWGDPFPYTEYEYEHLVPDIEAARASEKVNIMEADLGVALEVWAPVYDKDGNLAAMVEADYMAVNIYRDLNIFIGFLLLFFLICSIAVTTIMRLYLRKNLSEPLYVLKEGVDSFEHGRMTLDDAYFKKDDELKHLAISFEAMTHRIEAYNDEVKRISAEKERISTELSIATQIQSGMLPTIFPNFVGKEEYELYALMTPAKEVGGDFYDFFNIDDDHLALVIADVSGKGVPAALFMMMSMVLIKSRTQQGGTPSEILEYVNDQLCLSNPNEMFVTIWLGIIDLGTGNVIASSAGHEFPVIAGEDGEYKLFKDPHGFVCGGMEGMIYQDYEFSIPKGGRLFVYTDGVPEAHNEKEELFEFERIEAVLNRNKKATPEDTVSEMMKAIREFAGSKEQFDDITMLSFLYKGKTNA